jgi:hypothetical protein
MRLAIFAQRYVSLGVKFNYYREAGWPKALLDKFIGGWQLAGIGSLGSSWITLPASQFPTVEKVTTYGYKYKFQDCRSGRCVPGYVFWNGCIPAWQVNNPNGGVTGLPANYKPALQPLNPWPAAQPPKQTLCIPTTAAIPHGKP